MEAIIELECPPSLGRTAPFIDPNSRGTYDNVCPVSTFVREILEEERFNPPPGISPYVHHCAVHK